LRTAASEERQTAGALRPDGTATDATSSEGTRKIGEGMIGGEKER